MYPSYSEAVQVEAAGSYVYVVTKGCGTIDSKTGNLLCYDTEDGSVITFDCLHELSEKEIYRISYNQSARRLIIVYKSGNIDLLDDNGYVVNVSALMDASVIGETVSDFAHRGTTAYLCSDGNIIEVDVEQGIIRETYRTSLNSVYSIVELNEHFFVATSNGLYKFHVNCNMHDKSLWVTPISNDIYMELVVHDGHLFGRKEQGISEIGNNGISKSIIPNEISYLVSVDGKLIFGTPTYIFIYEGNYTDRWNNIQITPNHNVSDITCIDNKYYIAEGINGISSYDMQNSLLCNPVPLLHVDSPRRDLFYRISFAGNRLLVAGGINTQAPIYYPVTFMYMENDGGVVRWKNFDEKSLKQLYSKLSHYNGVSLVQDPQDDRHFYGAAYRNGLHEYRLTDGGDVEIVNLYNYENSPLKCINVSTSIPWNYCTCTSLQYDSNGNLWMANQQTDTIVRILRPNGKWLALYYPEVVGAENVYQYLFTNSDVNFMVVYGGGRRGFFGFDTSGTLNTTDDDRHLLRNTITNQDGATVMPTHFYCMTEDMDRQIWCGTNEGLFVVTKPSDWFAPDFYFHQIKRNRDDGSGLADYLLAGVDVTCIAVDPSNRKWIGTYGNGVYLVSHDGQETIRHFTSANSPLLSDNINSIAINPSDGRVMFGTDVGLCSFAENVTDPEKILSEENVIAYPNPVRPNTNAIVTIEGLTDGAEVKIVNSSGQVVWGAKSIGGSIRWNCCNANGDRVSSGVYHVVCNTADAGKTVVTRIIVLK